MEVWVIMYTRRGRALLLVTHRTGCLLLAVTSSLALAAMQAARNARIFFCWGKRCGRIIQGKHGGWGGQWQRGEPRAEISAGAPPTQSGQAGHCLGNRGLRQKAPPMYPGTYFYLLLAAPPLPSRKHLHQTPSQKPTLPNLREHRHYRKEPLPPSSPPGQRLQRLRRSSISPSPQPAGSPTARWLVCGPQVAELGLGPSPSALLSCD